MSPGKLRLAWRVAVGAAMDRATAVALLNGGVVEVAAEDLTWRREVKRLDAMIVSRLQYFVGADSVTKLKVVARPSKG